MGLSNSRVAAKPRNGTPTEAGQTATPLPRKDMVIIFLTHASQGYQTTMLFPMIVFMVKDFGVTRHNPALIGRYAGFLASVFPFAQFCTCMLWGRLSDKIGRKPVIILTNIAASLSATLFGLSTSYTAACLVRLAGGFMNGVSTVNKTALSELCDKTNQRKGFAVLSLGWGIGSIAGQIIGGVAARPCQQYSLPNCPPLLKSFPFILPCLGAAIFSAVATVGTFFLEETLGGNVGVHEEAFSFPHRITAKGSGGAGEKSRKESVMARRSLANSGGSRAFEPPIESVKDADGGLEFWASDDHLVSSKESGLHSGAFDTTCEETEALTGERGSERKGEELCWRHENPSNDSQQVTVNAYRSPEKGDWVTDYCSGIREPLLRESKDALSGGRKSKENGPASGIPNFGSDLESGLREKCVIRKSVQRDKEETRPKRDRSYLTDPDVWIASGAYGMTSLVHIIGEELFPIFAAVPAAHGGLGYPASRIGLLGGVSGASLFLFTLVFLRLNPRSARRCFTMGTLLVLPAFLLMPVTSLLTWQLTWQVCFVALLLVEINVAACMGYTGSMVLVSNSSDDTNMGLVTGFSHAIGSFARAVGPFLGGALWSFSVGLEIRLGQFIPWEVVALLTLFTLGLAALAKPYLDTPKSERDLL